MQTRPLYLPQEIQSTLVDCKQCLLTHYDKNIKSIILYGSVARQQLTPNSDIDLLVILEPPFDYFKELRAIVDLIYPIQLEASHWISAKPASINDFETGSTQLYRNVQEEGIVL